MVVVATAKPVVVYDTEVVSPYFIGATSSQYIARNYNGYYVAETPYVPSYSLPYTTSDAYTSYVL